MAGFKLPSYMTGIDGVSSLLNENTTSGPGLKMNPNNWLDSSGYGFNNSIPTVPGVTPPTGFLAPNLSGMDQSSLWNNIGDWWGGNKSWIMGDKNTPGLLPTGMSLANSISGFIMGRDNMKLGREMFDFQKGVVEDNMRNKKRDYNKNISDQAERQLAFQGDAVNTKENRDRVTKEALEKWGSK